MNYGIKDFDLLASTDGKDYRKCGLFTLKEAASIEDKHYHQNFDVVIKDVRYIRINVKTNHNTTYYCNGISNRAGLSKVKFFNDKQAIQNVTIHRLSSGTAFDPATDDNFGIAHQDAQLLADKKNKPYLRAWKSGSYIISNTAGKPNIIKVKTVNPPLQITGKWQVEFPPNWGAPEKNNLRQSYFLN